MQFRYYILSKECLTHLGLTFSFELVSTVFAPLWCLKSPKKFWFQGAESKTNVAINRENDTCFGNGLVMGSADYLYYAGLVKTPEKLF